ncbi:MAG: hypothetical protein GY754_03135 [bacterium]|nr:hypothetical protein [bacterium]
MSYDLIKANLNLHAVLKSMEDLVKFDPETAALVKDWNISIQFIVKGGPKVCVEFKNGECRVIKGKYKSPKVKLFFTSPAHLNKMMDGNGSPIPLKGITKLGFLTKEFPKVTDKLEYFLKPTDELLKDKHYMEMNTRMTLTVATNALSAIAQYDKIGKMNAAHLMDGVVKMEILEGGPVSHLVCTPGTVEARRGDYAAPLACLTFKNIEKANEFFTGKVDAFLAIASGDVSLRGQVRFTEAVSILLGRVEAYI